MDSSRFNVPIGNVSCDCFWLLTILDDILMFKSCLKSFSCPDLLSTILVDVLVYFPNNFIILFILILILSLLFNLVKQALVLASDHIRSAQSQLLQVSHQLGLSLLLLFLSDSLTYFFLVVDSLVWAAQLNSSINEI